MNTKPIPIIITLAAAFLSCVVSIFQRVDFSVFVTRLLIVVIVFMFLGTIIKIVLDYAFRTLEPPPALDEEPSDINSILLDDDTDEEQDSEDISSESEEG